METQTLENGQVQLSIIPSVPYVLNGITNKMYILFKFQINKQFSEEEKQRAPIELSIVLDRSGSMYGDKIENSKIAIKKIIDNLRNDDKIHFVIYDDMIEVIFQDGDLSNKDHLKKLVDQIYDRGSTNLSAGLIKGYKVINKDSELNKRIFLFSDGLANEGITSHQGILKIVKDVHANSVNISSFGIGRDFDEDLMEAIAETGAGDYFFIDKVDNIPSIVDEGLMGLLSTVTFNNTLKIEGKSGSKVTKIYSYELSGANLGDFRNDEIRQVLIELEVKPEKLINNELISYTLSYNTIDNPLEKQILTGVAHIKCTDNESDIIEENAEVMITRNLLEATEQEDKLIDLFDNRDYEQALELNQQIQKKLQAIEQKDTSGRITNKLKSLKKSYVSMSRSIDANSPYDDNDIIMDRKALAYSRYQTKHSKSRYYYDDDDDEET